MTYYLGRAGAMIALPDPEVGLPVTPERVGGTHQLLSGNKVRDTLSRLRTWELSYTAIDLTTLGTLQTFFHGTVGPGPYAFQDPEQRNLLPPNVSSGGDYSGDTTGFTAGGNVTATVSTDVSLNTGGRFSILMAETTSVVAFQDVLVGSAFIPVVPGISYTFSAEIRLNSNCPTHYTEIAWFDTSKTQLAGGGGTAYTDGTSFTGVSGGGRSVATGVAPAAAYAQVRIKVSTNNTAGTTVFAYTDSWQFEQASAATAWTPGLGVPLVTVESLTRSTPLAGICDARMTLQQVA